jgi:spoIIIJ-associated protein
MRVVLDIDHYRKRRADTLTKMAFHLSEKAKTRGNPLTVGPFNAHDRRLIHIALKEDPSIRTESLGEGKLKKINIIPTSINEEGRS